MRTRSAIVILFLFQSVSALTQTNPLTSPSDTTNKNKAKSLYEMDFEEISRIQVSLPSKKKEPLFDSPLSTTIITYEEIKSSGATSIPEALRLAPGVIVREKTNGNYDIHLRSNGNLPPGERGHMAENVMTLVMVDHRTVYSYFQGGTFWETLGIGIEDIDRIEIVRGPSTALYGPNAASGVINIITKNGKLPNNEPQLTASISGASNSDHYGEIYGAMNISKKISAGLSGNFQQKNRFEDTYYVYSYNRYTNLDSLDILPHVFLGTPLLEDVDNYYSPKHRSIVKYGANGYLNYSDSNQLYINTSFGFQNSSAQSLFLESRTSIVQRDSRTHYLNINGKLKGLEGNLACTHGFQNLLRGFTGYEYEMTHIQGNLDYTLQLGNLDLRSGVSHQTGIYDTGEFLDNATKEGFFRGRKELYNTSYQLRGDYQWNDKLRSIIAFRGDKYNKPDDWYHTYQFITSFKAGQDNVFRVVYSRANRGPFMLETYMDEIKSFAPGVNVHIEGNQSLTLPHIQMLELGGKSRVGKNLLFDYEFFMSKTRNYINSVIDSDSIKFFPGFGTFPTYSQYINLDLLYKQIGGSLQITFKPNKKLYLSAFCTIQANEMEGHVPDETVPDSTVIIKDYWTPLLYGGLNFNYVLSEKLNIHLNSYFMDATINPIKELDVEIPLVLILNTKISYQLFDNGNVFVNVRNIGSQNYQFGLTEKIPIVGYFGADLNF